MFGFGSGRIGPQESLIVDLEKAAKRRRVAVLPTLEVHVPTPAFFEQLRRLPRTEVVAARDVLDVCRSSAGRLATPAGELRLPSEYLVFEMEPLPGEAGRGRMVCVERLGRGAEARLTLVVLNAWTRRDWSFLHLSDMKSLERAAFSYEWTEGACSRDALDDLAREMVFASLGLLVLSDRQRAFDSATRH